MFYKGCLCIGGDSFYPPSRHEDGTHGSHAGAEKPQEFRRANGSCQVYIVGQLMNEQALQPVLGSRAEESVLGAGHIEVDCRGKVYVVAICKGCIGGDDYRNLD